MLAREKLPTSSMSNQVNFHSGYFFWRQDYALQFHLQDIFLCKSFVCNSYIQLSQEICLFDRNCHCLFTTWSYSGVLMVFIVKMKKIVFTIFPKLLLRKWEENTNVYFLALSIWQRLLCGDTWSLISKKLAKQIFWKSSLQCGRWRNSTRR